MNLNNPLVSVLMTAYNRETYIAEAIESVLNQDYDNFELIIVDDCSNDKTVDIVSSFKKNDKRIKLYINNENIGQFANRNYSASLAEGEIFLFVDSDDTIKFDTIKYLLNSFNENQDADFAIIYTENDLHDGHILKPFESIPKHFLVKSFLHIGPGGSAIRRDYFKKIGGFELKYGHLGDMFYNIKAASNTNIIILKYMFLNYRIHDEQEAENLFKSKSEIKLQFIRYGYLYFNDIMNEQFVPLNAEIKKLLSKKNKRRFIINIGKAFFSSGDIMGCLKIIRLVKFNFSDFLKSIFN